MLVVHSKNLQLGSWLEDLAVRIEQLCSEAIDCAVDGEILPTDQEKASAINFLKQVSRPQVPKLGLTVNGEITLAWVTGVDNLKAYVQPDGSVIFYQTKLLVNRLQFLELLNSAPPS